MKRLRRHSVPPTKLLDHIRELQIRLSVSAVALLIAGVGVYAFYEPLLVLLRSPLGAPLYYSSPAGSFAFVMKICFMGALAVTIPVIIYNLIMFVRPVFEKSLSLKRVYITTALSAVLALSGAAFAFVLIIPGALHFFAGFQVDGLSALISADSYLGFVTNVIITFVLMFQLPLLIAFIDHIRPLPPKTLFRMEKWVILGSLIVSALVPFALDITTSLLIALPIIGLYNLSIIIVAIQHAHEKRLARLEAQARYVSQRLAAQLPLELSATEFDDMLFEVLPAPISSRQPELVVAEPVRNTGRPHMDIQRVTSRPPTVVRVPRVLTDAEQTALSSRARLISDMSSPAGISRALTSQ